MTATTLAQIAAVGIASCGCVFDIRVRRIPNVLTLGSFGAALAFGAITAGWGGVGAAVTGWVAGLALLLIPFALGGMGAGDLKLLGAIGAWLGPSTALRAGLAATIVGGVLALVVAVSSGYLRQAWGNVGLMLTSWQIAGLKPIPGMTLADATGPRLAFAAPILVGTVFAIWLR